MGARLVERIAGLEGPGIRHGGRDRRNGGGRVVDRESPRGADERRTVNARHVRPRRVAGADVAGQRPALDPLPEVCERTVAAPAIGYAAHLLVHLALQIPRPTNAIEAAALAIRIVAIVRL